MSHDGDRPGPKDPPYPVGLLLTGRMVVVVGGGHVAQRRTDALLESGAAITVVSPRLHPDLRPYVESGRIQWIERVYAHGDLRDAWYAMATTDQPDVNAAVVVEADAARIFCVRADEALRGTAWTPASGHHDEITVAVMANRNPHKAAATRDALLEALTRGVHGDETDAHGRDG